MNKREWDERSLAPYACQSACSLGRKYPEAEHGYRSPYQRDRDRVIHSAAFRRLEYKTQVFVNHEGDYYRTRLTHSLEVSQIARTMARALCLNEDLTEALSLAHDLGHTPFGHAGEMILNKLMRGHGGFNHNLHTLRIVDELEERYPEFPGLNLTWETREGIVKHNTEFDQADIPVELKPKLLPTMEAQIVDIADEIAYDNHDLDDGLASGLIREEDLDQLELWRKAKVALQNQYPGVANPVLRYQIIRRLIALFVDDVICETKDRITRWKIRDVEDVRRASRKVIGFSAGLSQQRRPLRDFLKRGLYHHYRVNRMSDKAQRFIEALFKAYVHNTAMLPECYQSKISRKTSKYTVVCDYIAGMTDRYALDEHKKLFNPYEKV